jgi:hypothetical protein
MEHDESHQPSLSEVNIRTRHGLTRRLPDAKSIVTVSASEHVGVRQRGDQQMGRWYGGRARSTAFASTKPACRGWQASLMLAALSLGLTWTPQPLRAIEQVDNPADAAMATALHLLGGRPASECVAPTAEEPCVKPVADPESLSRGIARFEVSAGPDPRSSRMVVLGQLADGTWGYWFSGQDRQPELINLPGSLLACPGPRNAPATLFGDGRPVALGPLVALQAEKFVLTRPGAPEQGDAAPERGTGYYWVSSPLPGWIAAADVTDALFGDCAAHAARNSALGRAVTIESPPRGVMVYSPVDVRGRLTVAPLENTLVYVVYDSHEEVVGTGSIEVRGTPGQPGEFTASVTFDVDRHGPGRIDIVDRNAAGSTSFSSASVEVVLVPPEPQ